MIKKVLAGLIVLGVLAFAFMEWMHRAPVLPAPRPASVPDDAVWLGLNKGEWFQCHLASDARNIVNCTIYSDQAGYRISSGAYRWEGDTQRQLSAVPKLLGYDGKVISVEGGELVPTGKHVYSSGADAWTHEYPTGK